jgi:hypothetical protein
VFEFLVKHTASQADYKNIKENHLQFCTVKILHTGWVPVRTVYIFLLFSTVSCHCEVPVRYDELMLMLIYYEYISEHILLSTSDDDEHSTAHHDSSTAADEHRREKHAGKLEVVPVPLVDFVVAVPVFLGLRVFPRFFLLLGDLRCISFKSHFVVAAGRGFPLSTRVALKRLQFGPVRHEAPNSVDFRSA